MLKLKIKPVMQLRGIENPYRLLVSMGFAAATATNMLGETATRIRFDHLEKICNALNCTPNDLIEWIPPAGMANPENRALIKLKRAHEENMRKLLYDIPIEKFDEIIGIIHNLKDKE